MLAFARETRLSETTFVQRPTAAGADYRNRIFTVAGELPFAGHPSLGTAVAIARRRRLDRARFTQQTGAGTQAIEVELEGQLAHASMLQEPASFGAEIDASRALAPAGLSAADADPELPPQVVSTRIAHVIGPVRSVEVLARAGLGDPAGLATLLEPLGATVLYLAWCDPSGGPARARGSSTAARTPPPDRPPAPCAPT